MAFSADVWKQLKNLTAVDLIRALERDGWEREGKRGATLGFFKNSPEGNRRVVIHYHPQKTYGAKLIQGLLADIGWTETDLKRLKLIR
ncbi:MAG: hypothetical protein Kow001_04220 [Acidobacteriota bacterium]